MICPQTCQGKESGFPSVYSDILSHHLHCTHVIICMCLQKGKNPLEMASDWNLKVIMQAKEAGER